MAEPDPSHIMQVGMGFFASKTLLSAVELGLFTTLAKSPLTGGEIAAALGLHPRAIPDFPDALVAVGLLDRAGDGPDARYAKYTRHGDVPGPGEPSLYRRHDGDGECPALSLLGRPD
jgi:hypothetical protein